MFIGYSAAAFFDSSEIKINSWTHAARKIRGPMSPTMHPRDVICVLEKAAFENKYPVCNDGRVIIEEEHLGRKAELRCSTRNYLAPKGLEELELQHEGHRLDLAGTLYVPLTENMRQNLAILLPVDKTPGNKEIFQWRMGLRMQQKEKGWSKMSVKLSKK